MDNQLENNESFATQLKEARIRSGFDIETLARRLHIRPDILESIEAADFDKMPASGFTRNMVRAYARTVGLNQNDICDLYLNELNAFLGVGDVNKDEGLSSRNLRRSESRQSRNINNNRHDSENRRRVSSRRSFLDLVNIENQNNMDVDLTPRNAHIEHEARRRRSQPTTVKKSSRVISSIPHPNLKVDPKSLDLKKIIIAIIGIIIAIALALFIFNAFNSNKQKTDDVPAMPISGLTDTTSSSTS